MYISKHAIERYIERCNVSDAKHVIEQLKNIADVCDFEEEWNGNYIGYVGDLKLVADPEKKTLLTVTMRKTGLVNPSPPVSDQE
jgi:hypothetical protein